MRLLKSSSLYPSYLQWFYLRNPSFQLRSYSEQYAILMGDCAFYSDFWKRNLEVENKWQVEEIVVNCESMQRQWAMENGLRGFGDGWRESILQEQIIRFQPDVWFCHSSDVSASFRENIRRLVPKIRCIFGYDGVGRDSCDAFQGCDTVVCLLKESCRYYSEAGFNVVPRKLGFEPRIISQLAAPRQRFGLSFLGGIDIGNRGHIRRLEMLTELTKSVPVALFIPHLSSGLSLLRSIGSTARKSFPDAWRIAKQVGSIDRLNKLSSDQLFGRAMFEVLQDSEVTLNCHIDVAGSMAANFRLFESTGVGTCLLTDWKDNLESIFEPDHEVVVYRSLEECAEKARYLLNFPKEAKRIAERGQRRTLRDHTLAQSIWPVMEAIANRL